MRKILFLILSLGILSSCEKSPDEYGDPILLDTNNVDVLAGAEQTIALISDGNFGLTSFDSNVAYALSRDPHTIVVITCGVGKTTIRLEEIGNSQRYVDILVSANPLDGNYIESPLNSAVDKVSIDIMLLTPNQNIENEIKTDLTSKMSKRGGAKFGFDYAGRTFNMAMRDGTKYCGTYEWTPDGAMSITYNDTTEHYRAVFDRPGCISIYQDFTEYFQERYPSAGILFVEVKRFLSQPPVL